MGCPAASSSGTGRFLSVSRSRRLQALLTASSISRSTVRNFVLLGKEKFTAEAQRRREKADALSRSAGRDIVGFAIACLNVPSNDTENNRQIGGSQPAVLAMRIALLSLRHQHPSFDRR